MYKVKLPKNVAEAIDHQKYKGFHNIMEQIINFTSFDNKIEQLATIRNHFKFDWTMLASAIVNGYEIEETPEDKLKEYYNDQAGKTASLQDSTHYAIKHTLELLNIKIEGLNA